MYKKSKNAINLWNWQKFENMLEIQHFADRHIHTQIRQNNCAGEQKGREKHEGKMMEWIRRSRECWWCHGGCVSYSLTEAYDLWFLTILWCGPQNSLKVMIFQMTSHKIASHVRHTAHCWSEKTWVVNNSRPLPQTVAQRSDMMWTEWLGCPA